MKSIKEKLRLNLIMFMNYKKLNIEKLHEQTGLSRTTISNLLNSKSDGIKFETIERLCITLEINPMDLFKDL